MQWATLTEEQYIRLAECRSLKSDIVPIARAYMTERGYTAEDALVITLEHLSANSQWFDLTEDEWKHCINKLNRVMVALL